MPAADHDVPAGQCRHGIRAAGKGDRHNVDPGGFAQRRQRDVHRPRLGGHGGGDRLFLLLGPCDHFRKGVELRFGAGYDHHGMNRHPRNWGKILVRVVRELLQMRHDRVVARPEAEVERVAIRLGADDELRAHDPAAAGLVDQDQRLGGIFGPDFLDGPGQQVRGAPCREWNNDGDRLGREFILCHGDARNHQGGHQRNDEASDNNPFHTISPSGFGM